MVTLLDAYNVAVSLLSGIGLLYLLYAGSYVVGYRRFFAIVTVGLFVSVLGGPFLPTVSPAIRHTIHGFATLFIAIGLYDLVRAEINDDPDWMAILYADSSRPRTGSPGSTSKVDD